MAIVISLFDHSGLAVKPWANNGYQCYCFDILHKEHSENNNITYIPADLDPGASGWAVVESLMKRGTGILFSWPPCDDLTSSGAKHFRKKLEIDPSFQETAVRRATLSVELAEKYGYRWLVENPIGKMSTLWRKPDEIWNPYEFGGYLPENDTHPKWPNYIAARDAYPKKTGAWFGGGFIFPERKPVKPEILEKQTKSGRVIRGSRQFMKLGGKSLKTKEIRNMTPRGFSEAVYLANKGT